MNPIRVLVIDDSAFMRKMLTDILEGDPRVIVVGTARNGEDGISKVKELAPDVVTMDVNMPVLDGITALEEIMRTTPVPVIMLSSEVRSGTENTIRAIENGAVDFIMKPSGEISLDIESIKEEIISKVIAAKDATLQSPQSKMNKRFVNPDRLTIQSSPNITKDAFVVIGTSTGGPRALQRILKDLPADYPMPILIVQHMPPHFTKSLADRLDALSGIHVKEAVNGEFIRAGTAYIAPGDFHMTVVKAGTSYVIKLNKEQPINNHRPSVDALFDSVATLNRTCKIAIVLTGMGSDGAEGIRSIKRMDKDAITISESEETAVIYGMPKAAKETEFVDEVMPLNQIGHYLKGLS